MAMTLITNSADTDSTDLASITFDSGIDSTYKLYIFKFIDINPATDEARFSFQANAVGAADWNETMTTTNFNARHAEDDSSTELVYVTANDQAQGTTFQDLQRDQGNGADESCVGELYLFNPSSTTYVKHFYSRISGHHSANHALDIFVAGYFNLTAAIDDIQFKFSTGNFDGTIKMYGVG
jgi:hypothetical protein